MIENYNNRNKRNDSAVKLYFTDVHFTNQLFIIELTNSLTRVSTATNENMLSNHAYKRLLLICAAS